LIGFRKILLLTCLIYSSISYAQTSTIVFQSTDTSVYFTSILNKKIQNTIYVNNIKLTGLDANNKYLAELSFRNDTVKLRATISLLDQGFVHYYEVNKKGIKLKKIAPELDDTPDPNQYLVVCEKFAPPVPPLLIDTDTIKKDTLIPHFKMKDYDGKIGCPWPIKDDDFNAIYIEFKQQNLEDDKLSFIKEKLDTGCITSAQLSKVFAVFEYEESKLDFGLFIYPKTFDIDRFFDVANQHLKFESHIAEIREKYKVNK